MNEESDQNVLGPFSKSEPTASSETEPGVRMHIDFFFNQHAAAEDFRGLREALDRNDVYIPEGPMNENAVDTYRKVASGILTPEEAMEGYTADTLPFYFARMKELQELFNSQKSIVYIDLLRGDPSLRDFEDLRGEARRWKPNYKDYISALTLEVKAWQEVTELRELHMVQNLEKAVKDVVDQNAKGETGEKSVRILFSIGSTHRTLISKLKERGYPIATDLAKSPVEGTSFLTKAIEEQAIHGMVSEEALARLMLERLIDTFFKKHFRETIPYPELLILLKRKIIDQFTVEDITQILDNCYADPQIIFTRLDTQMIKKRIKMPKDKEGLERFVTE